MNFEQLKVFLGHKTKQQQELDAELEEASAQMEKESLEVQKMLRSKGWEVLGKFYDSKLKYATQMCTVCKPEELVKHQAEVKVIEELYGSLQSKLAQIIDN